MDKEILISVVIPVYNLEKYIIPCLDSIVVNKNVSPEQFEILVVNDGSADGTRLKVERYMQGHPDFNIRLFNQKNQGVSVARNVGLENAAGRFVWFIDGDDAIVGFALSALMEVIVSNDVQVIKIGECMDGLEEDNTVIASFKDHTDINNFDLKEAWQLLEWPYTLGHMTYIWHRKFLLGNELKYPAGITQNEDYCFLVSALLKADTAYINRSYRFYVYRTLENSTSRGQYDYLRQDKLIRNKFGVLERLLLLRQEWKNEDKKRLYNTYLNYYIHTIVSNCFTIGASLSLILYAYYKLKAMKLYPIKEPMGQISSFRKWLCNHVGVFVVACWMHRVWGWVYKR